MKAPFRRKQIFIALVILIGMLAATTLLAQPFNLLSPRFLCYLALALISSGLKVTLPGVTGTMSVSFLFILTGLSELGLPYALVLGLGSALVQIYWHAKKRPAANQLFFNLAVIAIAITIADLGFHSPLARALGGSLAVRLLLATVGYFVVNTFLVVGAISLTRGQEPDPEIWRECYFWAFPYYLLNATFACIIRWVNANLGWQFSLLALPAAWVLWIAPIGCTSVAWKRRRHTSER